jgi:hypothetical protein
MAGKIAQVEVLQRTNNLNTTGTARRVGPYALGFPEGGCMDREIPDADLFERDTERWLKRFNPTWSEERIIGALRTIRLISLVEFYEAAIKLHPDLTEKLPQLLPAKPHEGGNLDEYQINW